MDLVRPITTLDGVRAVLRSVREIARLQAAVGGERILTHGVTPYFVVPGPTIERIRTIVAGDDVVSVAAEDRVVTVSPKSNIGAGPEADDVVAAAADNQVVSAQRGDDVVAGSTEYLIGAGSSHDRSRGVVAQ